jgi:hypothetical protein
MPLHLRRTGEYRWTVYTGAYCVGGISRERDNCGEQWRWSLSTLFGRARGGSGYGAGPSAIRDMQAELARTWREQLAAAGIVEIPGAPLVLECAAAPPAPNTAHLHPLPYRLQREHFADDRQPADQYVSLAGGAVIVGMLIQDPWRNMDPRILRPTFPPWAWWVVDREAGTSGIKTCGSAETVDQARADQAASWHRWLGWAGLRAAA